MSKNEMTWLEFSNLMMGKVLYSKYTGGSFQKWQAYHLIKDMYLYVMQGNHPEYIIQDKVEWTPARIKDALYYYYKATGQFA